LPKPGPSDQPVPSNLDTQSYRFSVDGTRPVLEFTISAGKAVGAEGIPPEKLTIEIHTPVSGEVFEAKTSKGRIEVDRDGRVMYFSQAPDSVGFTLFLGHSLVVTMTREGGEVLIETPSRIASVQQERRKGGSGGLGSAAGTDSIRLKLE
jgi:hypothetical protein